MSLAALALVIQGCGESNPTPSVDGSAGAVGEGGSAGGSVKEDPDYGKAFPQDTVPRIDITITPENWQAMVDDMSSMLGYFGTGMSSGGPGGGGMPTQEAIDACNGLAVGDACTVTVNGSVSQGMCADMSGTVACQGSGGGPGGMQPPAELADACIGLAGGDACTATFMGTTMTGTCTDFGGTLYCVPEGGPGGPGGSGGGDNVDMIPRTPIYAECDVKTEDRSWSHVGIRFKGNSSLAMPWMQGVWKLPLRLNFDRFEDDYPETNNQRFYGFDSLSLSNGANDPSLMRDKVGTEVFVNAGIPAPATAFYRVYIDHGSGSTYFGLYTGIEIPEDDSFLETHFGTHKGNVYKPDGTGARWQTWDPETLGKENNEDEADYTDARALFDALHADRTDAAAWRAGLEAHLDVDGFLHWLALNAVVEDWDHYGRMPHNYYLYADPNQEGRFTWIPWDHSFAFPGGAGGGIGGQSVSLSMTEMTDEWPLIRYLLDDTVYLEVYRGYVAQAVTGDYEATAMEQRFKSAHDLIAQYVTGANGEITGHTFLSSPTAFDEGLATVIAHAKGRKADVDAYLTP